MCEWVTTLLKTGEQQQQSKTKQQPKEQLSSPLSQVLKTYDFGNFENCELKVKLSELQSTLYPLLYRKHMDLHRMI